MQSSSIPYLSAVLFLLAGCVGQTRPFHSPPLSVNKARTYTYENNVELFKVSNGLIVAVVPDRNTNLVQLDVRYLVGAAEDPPGKEGLAHLVEHLLFETRSTGTHLTIGNRLQDATLYNNAWTSTDATNYTSTGNAKRLKEMLEIERDRMATNCSQLSDPLLQREISVVRQELVWRGMDREKLADTLRQEYFGSSHPYHHTAGGSDLSVSQLTRADVCTFLDEHYGPNRALLVVSGAATVEQVRPLVGELFGLADATASGTRATVSDPPLDGGTSTLEVAIDEPAVAIAFSYPVWGSEEFHHADLLTDLLSEKLRERTGKGHLKSVNIGVVGGAGARKMVFVLSADQPGKLEKLVSLFFKLRSNLLEDQNERFFATRRAQKRAELVSSLESFDRRAAAIADYLQHTKHLWFMIKDLEDLKNLTLKELKAYSKRRLLRSQSRISYLTPLAGSDGQEPQSLAVGQSDPEMDISPWKSKVDKGEADAPLAFEAKHVEMQTTEKTLANGLRVILAPNFEYPTLDARLVYPVGDAMDPADKQGLAYWTARLLTARMNDNWTADIWNRVVRVQEMGGSIGAWTTDRATVFRISGLSMYDDGLLWKLHWLVESGTLGKSLKKAKAELARSKTNTRQSTHIDKAYANALLSGLFGNEHPYAAAKGLEHILEGLSGKEMEAFRDQHYGSNGATLIVSGKFDVKRVGKLISRIFGDDEKTPTPRVDFEVPMVTLAAGPQTILVEDNQRSHPQITIAYRTQRGQLPNRALRLVVEEMVDQRVSSVREQLGASYGIQVSNQFNEGPGSLVIRGTVNRSQADKAFKLITQHLKQLRSGRGIRDDFARARRQVLKRVLADSANATRLASQLVTRATYELPSDFNQSFAQKVASLRLADVREQLAKDLAKEREVRIIRGSKDTGAAMFQAVGVSNFRRVHSAVNQKD